MQTLTDDIRIIGIDAAVLTGVRPHVAGCNACRGVHGSEARDPIVRLYTNAGIAGWGWSRATPEHAPKLLGKKLNEVFDPRMGTRDDCLMFDFALWDLAGRVLQTPVHAMLGDGGCTPVPVYDGSIYMNDIAPQRGRDYGLQPILDALKIGMDLGFRAFKVKVGRGFQWMEKNAGFNRDVDVIHAVRDLIGPDRKLLIDANNGYTPEEAREVMRQCGERQIHWFEEPFPEEKDECVAFRQFLRDGGWRTLLADGEGATDNVAAFTTILRAGGIDVVQFDMRAYTLSRWLRYVPILEEAGALAAPHNWGSHLSAFYIAQFARACPCFAMIEVDTVTMPAVVARGYEFSDGMLRVPDAPGFGLDLSPSSFDVVWHVGCTL